MADDDTVSIKVKADYSDLTDKSPQAAAALRGVSKEGLALREALRSTGGDLSKVSTAMLGLEAGGSAAAAGINAASKAAVAGEGAAKKLSGATSGAIQEYVRLGHELMQGNFSRVPGTLVVTASRLGGLQTIISAIISPIGLMTAGAVALAGALAYVAVRAIEAENAIDQIKISAAFAGNVALTRDQIEGLTTDMTNLGGVGAVNARKVIQTFAGMKDETTPELQALSSEVKDFAQATNTTLPKAAEALAKAFDDPVKHVVSFVNALGGATEAQIDAAQKAEELGNANQAAAVMLEALDAALERARPAMDEHNERVTSSISNWLNYATAVEVGAGADDAERDAIDSQNKSRQKQIDLIHQAITALKTQPVSPERTLITGVAAAEREDTTGTRIQKTEADIQKMNAALVVATQRGDQINVDRLNAGLKAAYDTLQKLEQPGKGENAGEALIAQTRDQITRTETLNAGSRAKELQASRDAWASILGDKRLNAQQQQQVQQDYDNAVLQLTRYTAQQQQAIEREKVSGSVEVSRIEIEAQKSALDTELAQGKITADQKLAIMKDLVTKEAALEIQEVENEQTAYEQGTAEYERYTQQILIIRAKLNADLSALARENQSEDTKETSERVKFWKQGIDEIESAETKLMTDLLAMRRTYEVIPGAPGHAATIKKLGIGDLLGGDLANIGQSLIQKELTTDLKSLTTSLFKNIIPGLGGGAPTGGGLLMTGIMSLFGKGGGAAEGATLTTAGTTLNTAGISLNSAAGALTAAAGAMSAGGASSVASGLTGAASSAAGVASSSGGFFSKALGFLGLSFAGGAWEIPSTMPAMLHEGEMVVPSKAAEVVRSGGQLGTNISNQKGGNTYGDMHFNAPLVHVDGGNSNPSSIASQVSKALRSFHPAAMAAMKA